jgi:hypothetical protein
MIFLAICSSELAEAGNPESGDSVVFTGWPGEFWLQNTGPVCGLQSHLLKRP